MNMITYLRSIYRFLKHWILLKQQESEEGKRFQLNFTDRYPILNEWTKTTSFSPHYTYHTSWAARKLAETRPDFHIDIGSDLRFCTLVSAFIETTFYDYRPAHITLDNFDSKHGDLTNLHFKDDTISSLSCMHVVEHVGLGRYGDPVDYNGDIKAINELQRVLRPGGILLFVVPTGKPRIMFNAHRIYSYDQIISYFDDLQLIEFALLKDKSKKGLIYNADSNLANKQKYGCGCYLFKK
mgnify:FL=1